MNFLGRDKKNDTASAVNADPNASKMFGGPTLQEAGDKAEAWKRNNAERGGIPGLPPSPFKRRPHWEVTGHCPSCSSPIFAFTGGEYEGADKPPVVHRSCQCKTLTGQTVKLNNGADTIDQLELNKTLCVTLFEMLTSRPFSLDMSQKLRGELSDKFKQYIRNHDEETIRGQQMDAERSQQGKEGGDGG